METLLGHAESGASASTALPANAGGWRTKGNTEWLPTEGGPLTIPSVRSSNRGHEGLESTSRFAIETQAPLGPSHDTMGTAQERELAWKLRELLSSPLGEGVARIVEESYRVWSQSHLSG